MQRRTYTTTLLLHFSRLLQNSRLGLCLLSLSIGAAQADVVGHWRLEPGDDFYADSVGNAHLEINGARPESVAIPFDSRGALFPKDLPGVGQNLGGASFGPGVGELVSEDGPLLDDDFTIELFANVHNFDAAQTSAHLVAQTNPANASGAAGLSEFGWTLHVRMDGRSGSQPGELFLVTSDGNNWQHIESRILIDEDKDYFMAAAFDLDPGEATFYVHDLASNRLQINTAPRPNPHASLNTTNHFAIGGFVSESHRHQLHGVVDEIRLSDGVVELGDLLNGENVSPDSAALQIELGPRSLYRSSEQSTARDQRMLTRFFVDDSDRLVSKFDLPLIDGAELKMDTAKLRFYVDSALGPENGELSLWHSATDHQFIISADSFADESYVDTGLNLRAVGDDADGFVEIDVTELVRKDYASNASNLASAFRIQPSTGSRFRVYTGGNIEQRPQLLMTIDQNLGDFDRNGVLDISDVNQLTIGIAVQDPLVDINRDGLVDQKDLSDWMHVLKRTWIGDLNLDGEFNSGDLVQVFEAGHYEDGIAMNSGWAEGDWNGDGEFDTGDLVFAFQDGGFEQGPRVARAAVVAEPTMSMWMISFLAILGMQRRKWAFG